MGGSKESDLTEQLSLSAMADNFGTPKATLDLESFFPTGQHKGAPFKEKLNLV